MKHPKYKAGIKLRCLKDTIISGVGDVIKITKVELIENDDWAYTLDKIGRRYCWFVDNPNAFTPLPITNWKGEIR